MDASSRDTSEAGKDAEEKFFDEYYRRHAYNPAAWRLRFRREKRALLRILDVSGHSLGDVLSLGCGTAEFELLIARRCRSVLGIDLSTEAISQASANAKARGISNVRFEAASIDQVNWHETFDTVVAVSFFHHLPPERLPSHLRQIYSWLRQGGLLFSQDPNERGLLRKAGRLIMGSTYHRFHSPEEQELRPEELARSVTLAGFRDVSIGPIDFTLLPAAYIFPTAPPLSMHLFALVDRILARDFLAHVASGFILWARKI